MDEYLLKEARQRAAGVLLANGGDLGLLGAQQAYRQVWARESMIGGFGLWLVDDGRGPEIHRRSLDTLRRYQSKLGKIPHNVGLPGLEDPALAAHGGRLQALPGQEGAVEDTIHAGCVDSNLWYIVGAYFDFVLRQDRMLLREAWPSLEKALLWLRYQDSNECGLLEVHEAMDWADLFANRYNVLYDNVLYYAAWKCMAAMAEALGISPQAYREGAVDIRRKINALLWVGPEENNRLEWIRAHRKEWLYPRQRVETELVERPFYLPYMAFRDYADRCDVLANLLAIVFGVADRPRTAKILDYIHACGLDEPFPVRALYPPVYPGERDWREYYRVRNLNQPHHYHNGGAWPFIGGFYVAALVQARRLQAADAQLSRLVEMVRLGRQAEWEFNEWFHGQSGRPMGFAGQSWSAAMVLFASEAVAKGELPVFNASNSWKLGE
jgi:glycogen debranching enzyme